MFLFVEIERKQKPISFGFAFAAQAANKWYARKDSSAGRVSSTSFAAQAES